MRSFYRTAVIRAVGVLLALLATILSTAAPAVAATNQTITKTNGISTSGASANKATTSSFNKNFIIRRHPMDNLGSGQNFQYFFAGTAPIYGYTYYTALNTSTTPWTPYNPQTFPPYAPLVAFQYTTAQPSLNSLNIYGLPSLSTATNALYKNLITSNYDWCNAYTTTVSGNILKQNGTSACFNVNFRSHVDINLWQYLLNPIFLPPVPPSDPSPIYFDVLSVWYNWTGNYANNNYTATPDLYYVFPDGTFSNQTSASGVSSYSLSYLNSQFGYTTGSLPDEVYGIYQMPFLFGTIGTGTLIISPVQAIPGKTLGACDCTTGDPISIATGNEHEKVVDYTTQGANPLQFIRYYNSMASDSYFSTWLGHNWRSNYDRYLHLNLNSNPSLSTIVAERPDGKMLTFTWSNNAWVSDTDVDVTLTTVNGVYTLTDSDDTVETYTAIPNSTEAVINTITTRTGYRQTVNWSGTQISSVTDSYTTQTNKRQLTFYYYQNGFENGLLQVMQPPDGNNVAYYYDSSGGTGTPFDRLYELSFANGQWIVYLHEQSYAYYQQNQSNPAMLTCGTGPYNQPYGLTGILDESGNRIQTICYDGNGRGIGSAGAIVPPATMGANAISILYNDTAGTRTVTNALNEVTTYTITTLQGAPKITQIQRAGTAAATKTLTYDNAGYLNSETNWYPTPSQPTNTTTYNNNSHGEPTVITQTITSGQTTQTITTKITYDSAWVHLPSEIDEYNLAGAVDLKTNFTYYGESACPLSGNSSKNGALCTKTLTDVTGTSTTYNGGNTRTWSYTWTSTGQPASVTDPRNHTTYFTYQSSNGGVPNTVVNALGQTVLSIPSTNTVNTNLSSYSPGGLPLETLDANNVATTYGYDTRMRLTSCSVQATGGPFTTSYTMDGRGSLVKSTAFPDNSVVGTNYDAAYRLQSVVNGLQQASIFTYDLLGDKLSTTYSTALTNGTTTYSHTAAYNVLGWITDDIEGMNNPSNGINQDTSVVQYDTNGNPQIIQDQLGRQTTKAYDGLNRVIKITDPASGVTGTAYDAHGRVLSVTDPNNNVTTYTYDGFGDMYQRVSPDSGTTTYSYDGAGNVTQSVDASNVTANYTYDTLNRVTTASYPGNPAENETYTYDSPSGCGYSIGHLCTLTDASGTLTRTYDQRGNILTESRVYGTATLNTAYSYDAMNRVLEMQYPSGWTVKYTRDLSGSGQVTSIGVFHGAINTAAHRQQWQRYLAHPDRTPRPSIRVGPNTATILPVASKITHVPFGPENSLTYSNNLVETRQYDLDYRLTSIITPYNGGNAQSLTYSYYNSDMVNTITDGVNPANNQTLTYDTLDRLTWALGEYGLLGWTYDAVGNRQTQSNGGVTNVNYGYNLGTNQLASITTSGSSLPLSYTGSGNVYLINNGNEPTSVGKIGYNQTRRPRNLVNGYGQSLVQYLYDGFGKRLVVIPQGVTAQSQIFQYDLAGHLLETTDVNGNPYTDRIYLDDGRPVGELLPGSSTVYAIHTDRLGTPQMMTASGPSTVWQVNYHPFGYIDTVNSTATQPIRFPGQYQDNVTGWYMNGMRDYVPIWGVYLETDPAGLKGGLNTYAYAGSNPVNRVDPSGLWTDQEGNPDSDSGQHVYYNVFASRISQCPSDYTNNLAGKVWGAGNSAIGLLLGLPGYGLSMVSYEVGLQANAPDILLQHNAIEFTNNDLMFLGGAMTFGNVEIFANSENQIFNDYNVGWIHEGNHTVQSELLGPLYIPATSLS